MDLDIEKLGKLLALLGSDQDGEVLAAARKMKLLLMKSSKTITDVGEILKGAAKPSRSFDFDFSNTRSPPPPPRPWGFKAPDGCTYESEEAYRRSQEYWQRRYRDMAERLAPAREAVIAKYGSEDRALAPCVREELLIEAVEQWRHVRPAPNERWTERIDGIDSLCAWRNVPEEIKAAITGAYPMPRTIPDAKAEFDHWEMRQAEIAAIFGRDDDRMIDIVADLRRDAVRDALEETIEATSLDDLAIRIIHVQAQGCWMQDAEEAIYRDTITLAAAHAAAADVTAASGARSTATARRQAVLDLLSNPDTASLPDREIARRVGVSPQTVGNIRRRREAA